MRTPYHDGTLVSEQFAALPEPLASHLRDRLDAHTRLTNAALTLQLVIADAGGEPGLRELLPALERLEAELPLDEGSTLLGRWRAEAAR